MENNEVLTLLTQTSSCRHTLSLSQLQVRGAASLPTVVLHPIKKAQNQAENTPRDAGQARMQFCLMMHTLYFSLAVPNQATHDTHFKLIMRALHLAVTNPVALPTRKHATFPTCN